MIPFNWIHLFRQAWGSVIRTRGTHRQLTRHRVVVLLVFWILFVPHQIFTHLCLLLDNLLFPKWRSIRVEKPLFITGLFRSGTTFLHRLLAGDRRHFTTFLTWEIYLAPSILQRKLLRGWKILDRLCGSPAMKWLKRYDARNLGKVQIHKVGLWKEEEDEGIFLFLWDSLFTWFFFPDNHGISKYQFADREMHPRRQDRKLRFYEACVKRHLYCHPDSSIYLSKNPAFTPKIGSLKRRFPDARIVYMVRDPRRVLVSQAAWFSFCWQYFSSPTEKYPFRDELWEMTRHWYSYPIELFSDWQSRDYLILEYRDLIADPRATIEKLYRHFGLELDDDFLSRILSKAGRSDEYASAGRIDLPEVGYDEARVLEDFSKVFRQFDFD